MNAADLFYRTAVDHLATGNPDAARNAGRAGLQVDPDHLRLHEIVGLAEYDLEQHAQAVHYLEAASLFGSLGTVGHLALADCYHRFGQTTAATAVYEFLAEPGRCPNPALPDVIRGFGRLGRYEDALRLCERLKDQWPTYHPAWFGIAYYLGQLEHPIVTLVAPLEAALELAPYALTYRINLAAVYADLDRLSDAYALVWDIPADAVGCPCLCRRLARAFAYAGDSVNWIACLRRADPITDDTLLDWEGDSTESRV